MSLFREFDEDPFFSDPFKAHAHWVRKMMRSFSEPFDRDFLPRLTNGQDRALTDCNVNDNVVLSQDHKDSAFEWHCRISDMVSDMRRNVEEMQKSFDNLSADPNVHFFKSSSMITYSKVGNEAPKVFHAASQMRGAPGGIKETRRAMKDSESGVEKFAIGHHINDRGHIVEQKRNRRTGEREMLQDFQNMDESEAQSFEHEWQQRIHRFQPRAPKGYIIGGDKINNQKTKQEMGALKKAHFEDQNVKSVAVKK
ncbi:myeloid leukemia factor 1 isoform X1 [Arapaima gigas]